MCPPLGSLSLCLRELLTKKGEGAGARACGERFWAASLAMAVVPKMAAPRTSARFGSDERRTDGQPVTRLEIPHPRPPAGAHRQTPGYERFLETGNW